MFNLKIFDSYRVWIALLLTGAIWGGGILHAQHVNLSFTRNTAWVASMMIPAANSSRIFPDGISRIPASFVFRSGVNSVWNLDSNATVTCRQDYPYNYNQFFIGSGDGTSSSLTFTTGTLLKPGRLCARGDNFASFRIGEASTNSQGKLQIDGGVRIQTGLIYGEGPSPAIEILNGRLDVFNGSPSKRLSGIAVTLRPNGKLWIEDHAGFVKCASDFEAFAAGASISAPGGTLVFTNNAEGFPIWGNAGVSGTLISVNSSTDTDNDSLPDAWELMYQLNPSDNGFIDIQNGPNGDPDHDSSPNAEEYQRMTNPKIRDTDQDGLPDGVETRTSIFLSATDTGTDPLDADTDCDKIPDGDEVMHGSNPIDIDDPGYNDDRDGDGLPNAWEVSHQLVPDDNGSINVENGKNGDPDNDGIPNSEEFQLDSDPRSNDSGYAWQPRPQKAGLLVVAAHPDDEGIFFGGTIPYYAKVKGISTILLSMTSGDSNTDSQIREQQLRAAAWTYGMRWQPLFARLKDRPTDVNGTWDIWADGVIDGDDIAAGRLKAAMYVAKIIRLYRPEIIATHSTTGEYGHNDHIATCQSVIDAWSLAANPEIDIEGLPPWQPKKLYVHEWNTNRLFHDYWETPDSNLNGKTPRQTTLAGLQYHYNQSNVSTIYLTGEVRAGWDAHPSEWWGLYGSTVGYDTITPDFMVAGQSYSGWAKGDFLEHVTIPANTPPLIRGPSSIDATYPWMVKMTPSVTDDSVPASLSFVWTQVGGPQPVSFLPSSSVQSPTVNFPSSGTYTLRLTVTDGALTSSKDIGINALPTPLTVVHAINCGGVAFTAGDGTHWLADYGYSGGTPSTYTPLPIAGTQDDILFQKQRTGNCSYNLSVPNGGYLVRLRFAEPSHKFAGLRRFHVVLEGRRVTTSLDLFSSAGYGRAIDTSYAVNVTDGALNLQLLSDIDQPTIAAILVSIVSPPPGSVEATSTSGPPALALIDPTLDTDGDGVSDRNEFISGTSATKAESNSLTLLPNSNVVRFLTRTSNSPEYSGYIRRYRLEESSTLSPNSWLSIWTGDADGTWKEVPVARGTTSKFFRLATFLKSAR